MSIGTPDTKVLSREQLTVGDLYADMVGRLAFGGEAALASTSSSVAFADGADCLCAAVTYLRDGAARLAADDAELRERLEGLAGEMLVEAARFEARADAVAA